MKKLDTHVHCGIFPEGALEKRYYDAAGMLAHMDRIGVEKAVVMSGGETVPPVPGAADATNTACAKMVAEHPDRLAWMCNLDPVDPETVYDRLAACKANGAVGIGELIVIVDKERVVHIVGREKLNSLIHGCTFIECGTDCNGGDDGLFACFLFCCRRFDFKHGNAEALFVYAVHSHIGSTHNTQMLLRILKREMLCAVNEEGGINYRNTFVALFG
jgi:hypothetical protein